MPPDSGCRASAPLAAGAHASLLRLRAPVPSRPASTWSARRRLRRARGRGRPTTRRVRRRLRAAANLVAPPRRSGSYSAAGHASSTWWPRSSIRSAASRAARTQPSSGSTPVNGRVHRPTRRCPGSRPISSSRRSGNAASVTPSSTAAVSRIVRVITPSLSIVTAASPPTVRAARVHGTASARRHRTARRGCGSSRRCRSRARLARNPAATAAPDPPDDPPGDRSRFHGLCVGP